MKSESKFIFSCVWFTRIFLGFVFLGGGMSKLIDGFPGLIGPVWLEEALAEYGLGFFARFVAYSQVFAGLLLITGRYAVMGAVVIFPIILNILIITISLEWRGTPFVAGFFLLMNIFLLYVDYDVFKVFLNRSNNIRYFSPPVPYSCFQEALWWAAFCITLFSGAVADMNNSLAMVIALGGLGLMFLIQFLVRKRYTSASSNH